MPVILPHETPHRTGPQTCGRVPKRDESRLGPLTPALGRDLLNSTAESGCATEDPFPRITVLAVECKPGGILRQNIKRRDQGLGVFRL